MGAARRRYAEDSKVPIARTRASIEELLERWGADRIAWLVDRKAGRCEIQFAWTSEAGGYQARFGIDLDLEGGSDARGRFRTLFYWLRAAFDAIDAGVISAEELFLPWLCGSDGVTVGEALLPRLKALETGSAARLLQIGGGSV